MIQDRTDWRLDEWSETYRREVDMLDGLPKMTNKEIGKATEWLRENNYPKPKDCPGEKCLQYRPGCYIGVCVIAVKMCGDF